MQIPQKILVIHRVLEREFVYIDIANNSMVHARMPYGIIVGVAHFCLLHIFHLADAKWAHKDELI
jgi:hypothetical protein